MFDYKKYLAAWRDYDAKTKLASMYTPYKPVDTILSTYPSSYQPATQGTHLVFAWPFNFGVAWRIRDDERDDIGCNARFFSQEDAELFCAALILKEGPNSRKHYQVVKFDFKDCPIEKID